MLTEPAALALAAFAFAAVVGLNDGGVLVAPGLAVTGATRTGRAATLATAMIAVPVLVGPAVTASLFPAVTSGAGGEGALVLTALAVAVAVVLFLHRLHCPTSLTLAVVGGLVGAGAGAGDGVAWPVIARVTAVAALAPVAGITMSIGISRLMSLLNRRIAAATALSVLHPIAYGLQCVAYALNDGQKMFVLPLAVSAAAGASFTGRAAYGAAFAGFLLGMAAGARGAGRSAAIAVAPARSRYALPTELSSAVVVFGASAAGVPVSMTQTIAGSLAGSAAAEGRGRVRWQAASILAMGWMATLPIAFCLAVLAAHAIAHP